MDDDGSHGVLGGGGNQLFLLKSEKASFLGILPTARQGVRLCGNGSGTVGIGHQHDPTYPLVSVSLSTGNRLHAQMR